MIVAVVVVLAMCLALGAQLPTTPLPPAHAPIPSSARFPATVSGLSGSARPSPSSMRRASRGSADLRYDLEEISLWGPGARHHPTPLTKPQTDLILWMYEELERLYPKKSSATGTATKDSATMEPFEDAVRNLSDLSSADLYFLASMYQRLNADASIGRQSPNEERLHYRGSVDDLSNVLWTNPNRAPIRSLSESDQLKDDALGQVWEASSQGSVAGRLQYDAWRQHQMYSRTDRLVADRVYLALSSGLIPSGRDAAEILTEMMTKGDLSADSLQQWFGADWKQKTEAIIDQVVEFWSSQTP